MYLFDFLVFSSAILLILFLTNMSEKCRSEAKQWLKILKAYYSVAKVIILFFPTLDRDVTNRLTLLGGGGGGGGVSNHRLFDIIYQSRDLRTCSRFLEDYKMSRGHICKVPSFFVVVVFTVFFFLSVKEWPNLGWLRSCFATERAL